MFHSDDVKQIYSAAVLIRKGDIIAAAQKEHFTRKKHDSSMHYNVIKYYLKEGNIVLDDLKAIVFYDNPILTLDRFIKDLQFAGKDANNLITLSYDSLFRDKIWIHKYIKDALGGVDLEGRIYVTEHHISHAASAFFVSPFDKVDIVTIDGVGERATTAIGYGNSNKNELYKEIDYSHSLELLYSAFTYFSGFRVNYGDYNLMGRRRMDSRYIIN